MEDRTLQPHVYGGTRSLSADAVKASEGEALKWAYDTALKELTLAADNTGDMLDPNTVVVTLVVEAMSL
jgi:hypothetical protein